MTERMTDGLKRAEQYFLEMARGSQEGEDFALAEVCNRAADRIKQLEARGVQEKSMLTIAYERGKADALRGLADELEAALEESKDDHAG